MSKALKRPTPTQAATFAALGHVTRLSILSRLAGGAPQSIANLTAGTGLSRQGTTKHLDILADAGLVRSHRAGRETLFALRPAPLGAARDYLEAVAQGWDDALACLKRHVEG